MKTYSIHVTQLEENDKELYYFDELSLFISKIVKSLKMYNVKMINISDYHTESYEDLKTNLNQIINLIKLSSDQDESSSFEYDMLISITVDISPIEFPPEVVCTEEIATSIEKSLIDKMEIMKELGFIKLDENIFTEVNNFHFVYGNRVGNYLVNLIKNSMINSESNIIRG